MKQNRMMLNWLVGLGLAFCLTSSALAQAMGERTAQVVRIKGQARYSTGNNVWQPLTVGTTIRAGYIIQTAADSFVDLVLGETAPGPSRVIVGNVITYTPRVEQDVIRIFADSVLGFDKLAMMKTGADEVTDTQLDLRAGKIFGSVRKLSPASRYEVKLPNGVAGVRGTTFTITAAGVVQVTSGSVVVSWTGPDGKPMTQVVNAGNQFDLRTLSLTPLPPEQGGVPTISSVSAAREVAIDTTIYYVSPRVP
jgi:hypothetical protein